MKVIVSNYKKWYTGNNFFDLEHHHSWQYERDSYDLYEYMGVEKVSFDTLINIYKNLYNESIEGWEIDNKPDNVHDVTDFKNGKEFIIIEGNLFNLTNESYLDKKTVNELAYKLRKK